MKILHLITTLERGGAEKQLVILARNQRLLGQKLSVAALKGNLELGVELERDGISVFDNLRNKPFLFQIFLVRKLIKEERIDLLHMHLPRSEVLGFLASFGLRISLISTRHNTEDFLPGQFRFLSSIFSKFISHRFGYVISISNSVRSFLLRKREIAKGTNCSVIPYGFDDKISNRQLPLSLSHDMRLERFVTLSRLAAQKDLETMILGVKFYREKCGYGQLDIYGDGPLRLSLHNFARSVGAESYVFFRGRTENAVSVLQQSQAFLLTSKYEGFGLVLLEAMQQGIPIVCSRNATTQEIMGTDYPLFFETSNPDSLMRTMVKLQNPSLYQDLSLYGITRLVNFDPKLSAQSVIDLYYENLSISTRNRFSS